jgi:hypothetical protein
MRYLVRLALLILGAVALARFSLFCFYCWHHVSTPFDAYFLEAKMVHLAWRVQSGVTLYPEWRNYPYNPNFFGPLYSWVVGGLGIAFDANLRTLTLLGRGVTLFASFLGVAVGFVAGWKRYGWGAGVLAGLLMLGSAPMVGFGVMARCDTLADVLGLIGFLLATSPRSRNRLGAGGLFLAASALAKQTSGLYLIAACLSLIFERRHREAARLAGGVMGALLGTVGLLWLTSEPLIVRSLLGESKSPVDLVGYSVNMFRLWALCRELLLLAPLGLVLWLRRPTQPAPTTLPWTPPGRSNVGPTHRPRTRRKLAQTMDRAPLTWLDLHHSPRSCSPDPTIRLHWPGLTLGLDLEIYLSSRLPSRHGILGRN